MKNRKRVVKFNSVEDQKRLDIYNVYVINIIKQ